MAALKGDAKPVSHGKRTNLKNHLLPISKKSVALNSLLLKLPLGVAAKEIRT